MQNEADIARKIIDKAREFKTNSMSKDKLMKEIMDNDDIIFKEYYGLDINDELIDSGEICKNDIW